MHEQRPVGARCARSKRLDALLPTAVGALDHKRASLQVLRDIDTLLLEVDSSDESTHGRLADKSRETLRDARERHGSADSMPGPGTYNPSTRVVYKHTPCTASFGATSGRSHYALPWKRIQRVRTPGPGAYSITDADALTRPKITTARILRSTTTSKCNEQQQQQERQTQALTSPRASTSITAMTHGVPFYRGLVHYTLPCKPHYRTHEQKRKVRAILAARTRWTHVGFYDVRRACVEPRLGATKIVPMAHQFDATARTKRVDPTRLRRNLRMWRRPAMLDHASKSRMIDAQEAMQPFQRKPALLWRSEQDRNAFKSTEQYMRAQARRVLHATERTARSRPDSANDAVTHAHLTARSTLGPHAMHKQLGRDTVICRQRNRRVVTSFSSAVMKERVGAQSSMNAARLTMSQSGEARCGARLVPFTKTTGRDGVCIDKSGVYILGVERDQRSHEPADVDFDRVDAIVRPRVVATRITVPSADDERFPLTAKIARAQTQRSVLEPKFNVVEPSTRGHRFVRFENQLERPVHPTAVDCTAEQLVLPSEFPLFDKLKFTATHAFVDYTKMQGREAAAQHEVPTPLNVVCEPKNDARLARAPAPVDMSKMLARSDFAASPARGAVADPLRDELLCKLRANHDELERTMRLLSRYTRLDTGAVDMACGAPRFRLDHAVADHDSGREMIGSHASHASHINLSALSTRQRTDRTLVNMKSSQGRPSLAADRVSDNNNVLTERPIVLSVHDDMLSKCTRAITLVDMRRQINREDGSRAHASNAAPTFLDQTRDSATTRFLKTQLV